MTKPQPQLILHATTVCLHGKGVLIVGPSGAGKSSLALQLIGFGADLVADDRTVVSLSNGSLVADAPPQIAGIIEARGVGLLRTPCAGPTMISLVIDLGKTEPDRLPYSHHHEVLSLNLPCLWAIPSPHFAAAILLYIKGGISGNV